MPRESVTARRRNSLLKAKTDNFQGERFSLDDNMQIFAKLEITTTEQNMFEEAIEKLDQWSFDSMTYNQMLGSQGFQFLSFKVLNRYFNFKEVKINVNTINAFMKTVTIRNQTHNYFICFFILFIVGSCIKDIKKMEHVMGVRILLILFNLCISFSMY